MVRSFHGAFVGGEVSPHMFGRVGDPRVQAGLARCRNFVSLPQGPAKKRAGTRFVREVKDSTKRTRLIPFVYSNEQSLVVELGEGYFRFHTEGQTLLVATPTTVVSIDDSTDVLSFAEPHGLLSNTAVRFSVEGGSMPTGLSAYTTYYVITDTATTMKVSASSGPGAAVAIGAIPAGATLRMFLKSDTPADFVSSKSVSAIHLGTNQYTFSVAHGLATGDPIVLVTASAVTTDLLATERTNGVVVYYAIVIDSTHVKLASSRENALAGTSLDFVGDAVTFVTGSNQVQRTAHTLIDDEIVSFVDTGSGLTAGQNYYVVNANLNDFQVSLTLGGAAISLSNATGLVTRVDTRVHRYYTAGENATWIGAGAGFYNCSLPIREVTFDATADTVLLDGHTFADGTLVRFTTGGSLPSTITESAPYFVVNKTADDFQLSLSPGGSAISIADDSEGLCFCEVAVVGESLPAATDAIWHRMPDDGVFEIANGYAEEDLFNITYDQSNDVVSLAVSTVMESELRRLGATEWTWKPISFAPGIATPLNVTVTPTLSPPISILAMTIGANAQLQTPVEHQLLTGDTVHISGVAGATGLPDGDYGVSRDDGTHFHPKSLTTGLGITTAGAYTASSGVARIIDAASTSTNSYKVSAVLETGVESDPSAAVVESTNNLTSPGAYNTISWSAVAGAVKYRIYRELLGQFGRIGETESTSFKDENEDPDLTNTPPLRDKSLRHHTPYSSAVGHFEQSRVFGRGQQLYFTVPRTESELSYNIPLRDDSRIQRDLFVRQYASIRHVVPLDHLMLLTTGIEIRVSPRDSDVITPTSITSRAQTYIGSSPVQPVLVNSTVVFAAARGGHVRELGFQFSSQSYITGDLSMRAMHLFDDKTIADMAYQKSPIPIVWCVSSDGTLLGFTYVPEENVGAWHWHDTDGLFESVCSVPEGDFDAVYVVVQRNVNGADVRYIETFAPASVSQTDGVYVDSAVTLSTSSAVSTVSGLDHLNGKTVAVVANGAVQTSKTVVDGSITLATPLAAGTNVVNIGLLYTGELYTVPFYAQIEGAAADRTKNIDSVWLRVETASQFMVGPTTSNLRPAIRGNPTALYSGVLPVGVDGLWSLDGQVVIQHTTPLPLTVVSMTTNVVLGG